MDWDDIDGDGAWWIAAHAVQHSEREGCEVCCYLGLDCVEVTLPTPLSQILLPPRNSEIR